MSFNRTPPKILPDGELSTVFPFHVCSKGPEDKVIFRDDEDLRVAHNYIPICARRANVIVASDCVLNTHFHSLVLARNYEDANSFANKFKMSASDYLKNKYANSTEPFRHIDSAPLLIEDNRYLRNVICYIYKNAHDMGARIDEYKWSSYSSVFQASTNSHDARAVSKMTAREVRNVLRTGDNLHSVNWLLDQEGRIVPSSYCDWEYVESAFNNDLAFFTKILGLTDDAQMEQMLVTDHVDKVSVPELILIAEDKSQSLYHKPVPDLTISQKIPIIKRMYHSLRTTPNQLARCFGLPREKVNEILRIKLKI